MNNKSIIIVGGGPVGFTLGLKLAQEKFKVNIFESQEKPFPDSDTDLRTFAINQQSCDLLRSLNLWQSLNHEPIKSIKVYDQKSLEPLTFVHKNNQDVGYMISAYTLKKVLWGAVSQNPYIHVHFRRPIQKVEFSPTTGTVETINGEQFDAPLILATDGRRSAIRDMLKLPTHITDFQQTALVGIFAHKNPHQNQAIELFTPVGPLALLPTQGQTSAFVFSINPMLANILFTEPRILVHFANQHFPQYHIEKAISPVQKYPLLGVEAQQTFYKRCLLVGDAALGVHPVAGQGLNLGLADISLLCPHLVKTHNLGLDIGSYDTLRSFQHKRAQDRKNMMLFTKGIVKLFSNNSPTLSTLRRLGLSITRKSSALQEYFTAKASGF